MRVLINKSGELRELTLIDLNTGIDYILDFIGLHDDLQWSEDDGWYVMDKDAYQWWKKVVDQENDLQERIYRLSTEYGRNRVYDALSHADALDLEHQAWASNKALDEAFGPE